MRWSTGGKHLWCHRYEADENFLSRSCTAATKICAGSRIVTLVHHSLLYSKWAGGPKVSKKATTEGSGLERQKKDAHNLGLLTLRFLSSSGDPRKHSKSLRIQSPFWNQTYWNHTLSLKGTYLFYVPNIELGHTVLCSAVEEGISTYSNSHWMLVQVISQPDESCCKFTIWSSYGLDKRKLWSFFKLKKWAWFFFSFEPDSTWKIAVAQIWFGPRIS